MIEVIGNDKQSGLMKRHIMIQNLADELGKSIYKQLTINEKYLKHNFTYEEHKEFIEFLYAKIFELLYADKYGIKKEVIK